MHSEEELNLLIEKALAFQTREHEKNRRRVRNAFLCMLIVPTAFLVLLFLSNLTGTSKLIMLVVWIASMFVIAAYLIVVDYMDYKLMHMMDSGKAGEGVTENAEEEEQEEAQAEDNTEEEEQAETEAEAQTAENTEEDTPENAEEEAQAETEAEAQTAENTEEDTPENAEEEEQAEAQTEDNTEEDGQEDEA